MPKYRIYAGLGGGFGGAEYIETSEFQDEEQAMLYAWEAAMEVYDGYAGMYGISSYEELAEEYPDYGDDELEDMYLEEAESWLDYYVEEIE